MNDFRDPSLYISRCTLLYICYWKNFVDDFTVSAFKLSNPGAYFHIISNYKHQSK